MLVDQPVDLEFWEGSEGIVLAHAQSHPTAIPNVNDEAYVPSTGDPGVYVNLLVTSRRFFYDEKGVLKRVRLVVTESLPSL